MQIVLERGYVWGSIHNPLNFNIGLLQLIFHTNVHLIHIYACKGVFDPNITIFPPNFAEGLHFSAFHFILIYVLLLFIYFIFIIIYI